MVSDISGVVAGAPTHIKRGVQVPGLSKIQSARTRTSRDEDGLATSAASARDVAEPCSVLHVSCPQGDRPAVPSGSSRTGLSSRGVARALQGACCSHADEKAFESPHVVINCRNMTRTRWNQTIQRSGRDGAQGLSPAALSTAALPLPGVA